MRRDASWRLRALVALTLWALAAAAQADPKPGDVFREYRWTNAGGDAGGSFRVGGKKGAHDPGRGSDTGYINDPVALPQSLDLEHAIRAEAVIEKLLCHDGTRGLAISVNGHSWITIPEASGIPEPQWEYQHHIYPVVAVPLDQLKPGAGNQFRLRVSPEHSWNWPQNLIYGAHFRIYYDPAKKPHATGRLASVKAGDAIGRLAPLEVETQSAAGEIARVDFIGNYEDVNYEGDGQYRRWHYRYNRAELINTIGCVTSAPWRMNWNTSWVPDQVEPMALAAWITDRAGVTYFTEAIQGVRLQRPGFSVELCKPYDVSKQWVTRKDRKQEKFKAAGDLRKAVAAQLVFTSWSPGYLNGLYINDHKVFGAEGDKYRFGFHRIPLADLSVLRPGENTLRTGQTPRDAKGNMVHGAEISWPGVMVLIQYGGVELTENASDEGLDCYRIQTPAATYFLEKSGAGLSSMIDPDGADWLGFSPAAGSKAAGEFRGFPNAVNRKGSKGYFHPMNSGTGRAKTSVEYSGSDRVTIAAASENGRWGCRYDFLPTHCVFTMTKKPANENYWVLYEGTPGGGYDETDWWVASGRAERSPLAAPHEGDLAAPEWIAFGDAKTSRTLFLASHENDAFTDRYYPMDNQMTVFGFGREGMNKSIDKVPRSFSISFVESGTHEAIARMAAQAIGMEYPEPESAAH